MMRTPDTLREPRGTGRGKRPAPPVDDARLPALAPRRRPNPWVSRALVFVTCVLLLDALFGERSLAETLQARRGYDTAVADLQRMKQENAGLREQIRRLQDDPATIEALAREELGLIKPGEVLVVIRDARDVK